MFSSFRKVPWFYPAAVVALLVAIVAPQSPFQWSNVSLVDTTPCVSVFQIQFDDPTEIQSMNQALALIQETYPQEFTNSTISHHFFVKKVPEKLRKAITNFVWTKHSLQQLQKQFAASNLRFIPDVYHEIYLMRQEFDLVDQNKVHYDGILKLAGICTVRSLTYISGGSSEAATLVALTSGSQFFTLEQTSIVLDFNRELHYASLSNPNTNSMEPRVMVKAAVHVVHPDTPPWITWVHILAHRIMFFAIKSLRNAFESSSSSSSSSALTSEATTPNNLVGMMALDNVMRGLNKIHIALPVLLVGIPVAAIIVAPILFPLQFISYLVHVVVVCYWNIQREEAFYLRLFVSTLALGRMIMVIFQRKADAIRRLVVFLVMHAAWIGVCLYVEKNADMAHSILLAPIPQSIGLGENF